MENLLKLSKYNEEETKFLVQGFREGFDLGYRGDENVRINSENLRFRIGDEIELWNKVMKEVKNNRYAGPFEKVPSENYIQSPIGLVPKDGGKATRLIFHLSYPKVKKGKTSTSINANTPKHLTTVKYLDVINAIWRCLEEGPGCAIGKSDFSSAFRHFPINRKFWKWLVMKARNPEDGKFYYFIDKCMPFGAAISCSHFQRFSNAVAHIFKWKTRKSAINYLDDYFFAAVCVMLCNRQIQKFLEICHQISFPVSLEKTFWGTTELVFLGTLINTVTQTIAIPLEKVTRAKFLIETMINSKKTTKVELQSLCGLLNFFCRCIIPGRAFCRRLYSRFSGVVKPNHHIDINSEMRLDLRMWLRFLNHQSAYSRSFFDTTSVTKADQINFFTDASRNYRLGCGGICGKSWYALQWDPTFIQYCNPSINYLELYAVVVGVLLWIENYQNRRIVLFCDNMSVVHMINNNSSSCHNCMVLIRILVLHSLIHNVRVYATYIPSKKNKVADWLSHAKFYKFRLYAAKNKLDRKPQPIPEIMWPLEKLWSFRRK